MLKIIQISVRLGAEFETATMNYNYRPAGKTDTAAAFSRDLTKMTVKGNASDNIKLVTSRRIFFLCITGIRSRL